MTSKGSYNNSFVKDFSSQSSQFDNNLWKKSNNTTVTLKDVNSDLYLEKNIIVKGILQNPSDINLKTNIKNITKKEANLLNMLHPVTFEYIDDVDKHSHYGLIAQDVEKYYPDLVKSNLSCNYKSVNYVELIPLLIAKIQKLEEDINILKSKIE